jgi:MFS family permease
MTAATLPQSPAGAAPARPTNAGRLFLGSCMALIATSTAFAVVGASMLAIKNQFILTNAQVGWIGGAALWGFTVSMVVFGPFVDTVGMKNLLRLAFATHLAGALTMIFAGGYAMLFIGALVIAMGNGLVEAACNPLVAAIYPENKTVKLNQFHVWFPGGTVLGGLASYALDQVGITDWRAKLGLILIPTVLYGIIFLGQHFPQTERVRAGYTTSGMWRATLMNPLFLLLLGTMAITASLELGPNRWVPAVLQAGGIPGILVLVYINGLMAILRYRAGDVVHRVRPTGILLASAILAGLGLLWLSYAETTLMAFAAATVFAVGVCYFWPTMLGLVAERNVRGGALALALMGGMGMAATGLVTSPAMGKIADRYAHERLPVTETVDVLRSASTTFPELAAQAPGRQGEDMRHAAAAAQRVVATYETSRALPEIETANALRAIESSGGSSPLVGRAQAILGPADNFGGRMSFRWVAPFSILAALIFAALFVGDRKRGAYSATDGAEWQREPSPARV